MKVDKKEDVAIAKWYVKQVLDGIDCVDQTNTNTREDTNCFYLTMNFEDVEQLTRPLLIDYKGNKNSQEYVNKLLEYATIKSLYNYFILPYKIICLKHVNQEFVDWPHEFARHYLNIVISDIMNLEDSRDYPKGLQTTSDYFEDLFEDHIIFHKSITVNDFPKVADIFDTKLEELKCKINKQRELDGI